MKSSFVRFFVLTVFCKETDDVQGDEQFEIDDNRSLDKMYKDIAEEGLQPVLNDYLYV